MKRALLLCVVSVVAVFLASSGPLVLADEPEPVPGWEDFVQPVLDQESEGGLAFFPATHSGGKVSEVQDPDGYFVHLAPVAERGKELVFPAGVPFKPPSGRVNIWLESEWNMTPRPDLVVIGGRWPAEHKASARTIQHAPAGRIDVAVDREVGADLDLWLLYTGATLEKVELSRWSEVNKLDGGLLMPPGLVVAGLWNRREESWTALSQPFQVAAEKTISAPLKLPNLEESWLKVYLKRSGRESLDGLTLSLSQNDVEHAPDFMHMTTWGVHAIWNGLEPGASTLIAGNSEVYHAPQAIELSGAAIEHFDGTLVKRPRLRANLRLPSSVREEPLEPKVLLGRVNTMGNIYDECEVYEECEDYVLKFF